MRPIPKLSIFRLWTTRYAQSALELITLLVVVVVACYIGGNWVHRASNGRIKALMDELGVSPYDSEAQEVKTVIEVENIYQVPAGNGELEIQYEEDYTQTKESWSLNL